MKYLANDRNIVRDATLTATNTVASNVVYRTDDDEKKGGGQVALTGDYTGASDATIDVKIVDTTISGTPKISAPTFTGIGNGTLTGIAADSSTAAQVFTLALEDLGTSTAKAYAPFQGVTLRAKSSGTAGNAISVSVDNSGLAFADTAFALQHDINAGTNEYVGDEWNFGAAILNPDLTIPDSAPRVSFGADPQVYRQYKFYRDGHYVFAFSPSPVRDVPRGTVVKAVTGTHSVAVSNGGTTDTISGCVSLYDALAGIRDTSTLVDVVGAIVNDKTSGGQAAVELSVWTVAYVTGLIANGSDAILHSELVVTPAATAPTETLQILCVDGTTTGAEKWQVRGDVSGRLADAITGALYGDGPYTFTIPAPPAAAAAAPGQIAVSFILSGERESAPDLCAVLPLIGAAGRSGTWEFVWQTRTTTCSPCTDGVYDGSPNYTCLGIDPPGGTSVSDESRLIRLQRLSAFVRELVGENTPPYPTVGATDTFDVDVINKGAGALQKCLESIASATPLASWQASHVYVLDDMRQPTTPNGYRYAVTVAGTSSGSPPSFPTSIGATVTDGGVTWTNIGKTPYGMWDDMFAQFSTEMRSLAQGFGGFKSFLSTAWAASTAYPAGVIVHPATRNGHLYYSRGITTSGGSTPTFPTQTRAAVEDGDGYWVEFMTYWTAGTVVKTGTQITIGDGYVWEAEVGGTTGGSEPTFTGNAVTDNTVTWVRKAAATLTQTPLDQYFDRFTSLSNEILAAAGIDPTFKQASTDGDGCWHDYGGDGWFVFDGTDTYLPLFAGRYNYSAKKTFENGIEVDKSSQEWGVGLKFCNTENLAPGDRIRITIIDAAGGRNGYQAGDLYAATITHAEPIPLGGGQAGNDTLTFHFGGTVDGTLPPYYVLANSPGARANSHPYLVGDRYVPAVANGRFYECTAPGTSAGSPPVFTTNRTSFTDGAATFLDMGNVVGYNDSGLQFLITPGGIAFGLGDTFVFDAEGGHFEWRINGGSWSSATAIADSVLLTAGLSATFTGGAAPSWKVNDQWSFTAEAINGVDGIRQPTDKRMSWTGSTQIDIVPTTGAIDSVLLGDHTIPSDATIHLQGSNDNFSTTPLNQVLPWKDRHIKAAITATYAKYRVTIDRGGSMNWLVLEKAVQATLPNGVQELGAQFTKHIRMPNLVSRKALGATLTHTALTQASVDDFVAMLAYACQYDDGRIGIIPNDSEDECAIVQFAENTLDITDTKEFQPRDPVGTSATPGRLLNLTLTLTAVA